MKKSYTIVVADDEPKIVEVLSDYLQKGGYHVITASTGQEVLDLVERNIPSLVILDLMLPDVPGEEVCKVIRTKSPVPVLMLTAKYSEDDRLRGLQLGADDYVVKPFSVKEVVARVGVILRRTQEDSVLAAQLSYQDGELVIDAGYQIVRKRGNEVDMTVTEYRLLSILARHPKRVFHREELIETAFGIEFRGETRVIDTHIKNLRAKIEEDPHHPVYIQTVYGVGYRFGGDDG